MRITASHIKGLLIVCGILVAAAGLTALVLCEKEASRARPLYGDFDMGLKCMGGHEIFLRLEEHEAFNNCPGHRDKDLIGKLERTGNSAIILRKKDNIPWMRVDWNGSFHSLVFLQSRNSSTLEGMASKLTPLPQVTNPFRTKLPRYLPED